MNHVHFDLLVIFVFSELNNKEIVEWCLKIKCAVITRKIRRIKYCQINVNNF